MKYKDQQEMVEGLRELADFIEAHIELPIDSRFKLNTFLYDSCMNKSPYSVIEGSAKNKLRVATKALGKAEKRWGDYYIDVARKFGPITLEFTINKGAVCERIVTGTKEVPEQLLPARTEEIVEWKCVESILMN